MPRGHDLPDFNQTLGHDAILRRTQHGVAGLVIGNVEFGLDLLEARLAGAVEVFVIVVLRTADQLTLHQGFVAITLGTHHAQIGFSCSDLSPGGLQLQAHILRIELCQRLIGLDPLPFLDQSSADFTANAERQVRLITRADFTWITFHGLCRRLWLNHHGRAHADWRHFVGATRRQ
ncbi:hypothetical protein D3C76_819740 [compost metagenome]